MAIVQWQSEDLLKTKSQLFESLDRTKKALQLIIHVKFWSVEIKVNNDSTYKKISESKYQTI